MLSYAEPPLASDGELRYLRTGQLVSRRGSRCAVHAYCITHNAHTDRVYALSPMYPQSHARFVTECSVSALQHFAFLRGAGESVTFASKPVAGPLFIRNSRETCGALALGVVDGR